MLMRCSHCRANNTQKKCKDFSYEIFCVMKEMPGIVVVLYNSPFPKISVIVKRDFLVNSDFSVSLQQEKKNQFIPCLWLNIRIFSIKYCSTDCITPEGRTSQLNIGQSITVYFVIHKALYYIVTHMSKQIFRSLLCNKVDKCAIGPLLSVFHLLHVS